MSNLRHIPDVYSNVTDSAELVHNHEQSLELADILPIKARSYDKNRAPKLLGQPTVVYFHVTVLSIDSINEESMTYVTDIFLAQRYLLFRSLKSFFLQRLKFILNCKIFMNEINFSTKSWRDPRLRLPENMSEEYRILDVEWLHSIWRPGDVTCERWINIDFFAFSRLFLQECKESHVSRDDSAKPLFVVVSW